MPFTSSSLSDLVRTYYDRVFIDHLTDGFQRSTVSRKPYNPEEFKPIINNQWWNFLNYSFFITLFALIALICYNIFS